MIFLLAASPWIKITEPCGSPETGSTTSVIRRQPLAAIRRASANPTTQSKTRMAARTPARVFIACPGTGAASEARDKLDFSQAEPLLWNAAAWSSFEFVDTYPRASDFAVWTGETQRAQSCFHKWLLRLAASWTHSEPRASARAGRPV